MTGWSPPAEVTLAEAARRAGVTPATLRRWTSGGLVPGFSGRWTPACVAHARIIARLRRRGHSLQAIGRAAGAGRLAFGQVEDLFTDVHGRLTVERAGQESGLDPALVERIMIAAWPGFQSEPTLSEEDVGLLRYVAAVLAAGFPVVALLQLVRVYGQAIGQLADAEVRLFHLYVHEPLMREGVPALDIAEEMEGLARDLLPLASPIIDRIHHRWLARFIEQDAIGHMEADLEDELDLGRLRVAVGFADLAGYTRLTEEAGEDRAIEAVERFVEAVEQTLPDDARVVKTIGDEVMVVAPDAGALTDWAVGFQQLYVETPRARIGLHHGPVVYRDGDYWGREVNLASRVAARSAAGEVLVTRAVVEHAGRHLEFEPIGEVRLRGFAEPTELFLARARGEG